MWVSSLSNKSLSERITFLTMVAIYARVHTRRWWERRRLRRIVAEKYFYLALAGVYAHTQIGNDETAILYEFIYC
jgi:hypothetical protein